MTVETKNSNTQPISADAQKVDSGGNPDKLTESEGNVFDPQKILEELERTSELKKETQEYIKDLKAELNQIKRFRFWITLMAIVFSLGLFGGFVYFSLCPPPWFSGLSGSVKIPFLISLSVMSVLLVSLCLRGVYQTRKERNYDDYLPESIKLASNAMGNNP